MTPEELVRRLAAHHPVECSQGVTFCPFCGINDAGDPTLWENPRRFEDPERHNPSCLWRQAVEWAAGSPTPMTPSPAAE